MEFLVRTTMSRDLKKVIQTGWEVADLFCLNPEVSNGLVNILKSFYFSKEKMFYNLKDAIDALVCDISSNLMESNNLNACDKRLLKFSRSLKEILYKDLSYNSKPSFTQNCGSISSSVRYCLITAGLCNSYDTIIASNFNISFSLETI